MINSYKVLLLLLIFTSLSVSQARQNPENIPLNSMDRLKLINVKAKVVTFKGKEGMRVEKEYRPDGEINFETLILIEDIRFENGIIELEISGEPAVDALPGSRGFVGVAFRIDSVNYSNYECIYLRPVNGRSDNQLQRNHSVQYISHPEYPWYRLRKEHPGVYESYVDLVPGEWISIRIVVSGQSAQLYVHENSQPTLMINDLKHGERGGQIGLWLHTSTVAHYRNLRITHSD